MGLVDRVKNILLSPRREWGVIDTEPATVRSLYTGYIMPLAAIPVICQAIGMSVFGMRLPFVGTWRTPIGSTITRAVVMYVLTLIGVYILALIIDNLAPTFSGTRNQIQALKVAAYSYTAAWVVGIFYLVPALSVLGILGLYSLYLLYLGLPILMKSPPEKAFGYTAVVIIVGVVLAIIIAVIAGRFVVGPAMGGFTP
jgi:Yip1 domain